MSFERWYAKDCGIGNEMFANYLAFHGESLKDVGRHDLPWGIHGSRVRPRVDEWDGGWDNVIRTLEDQR